MTVSAARAARGAVLLAALVTAISSIAVAQRCGYYTNSAGYYGPRPCGGWKSAPAPPRATIQCRDGSSDYADNQSSACIAHGGVAATSR